MEASETVSEIELGYIHCLQGGFDFTMCVSTGCAGTTSRSYQRISAFVEFDLAPMTTNISSSPESTSWKSSSSVFTAEETEEMLQLSAVPVYYRLASHSDANPCDDSDDVPLIYETLRRPRAFAFIGTCRCQEERNNRPTVSQTILASLLERLRTFLKLNR